MKIIAAYHKAGAIAYTSHLDVQRTLQRAFRRADLPLAYSQGFNPHPLVSFATALATGYSSDCEWFELRLTKAITAGEFTERVNAVMPEGMWLSDAFLAEDDMETLSKLVNSARYKVTVHFSREVTEKEIHSAVDETLAAKEIFVMKKTKGGIKNTDIRQQINKVAVEEVEKTVARFDILGELTVTGGLRVEPLVHYMLDSLDSDLFISVHRAAMYFDSPQLPQERKE